MTLVLARERSIEGIREAMVAGRTLAWFKNLLIGRAEHVAPVLEAALTIAEIAYLPDTELLRVVLRNRSDARWQLMNRSSYTFMGEGDLIEVPPHGETVIDVKAGAGRDALALPFDVLNALVAPGTAASITLQARL